MSRDLLAIPGTVGNNGKVEDLAYNWLEVLFNFDGGSGFGAAFATFTSMLGLLGGLFLGWHIIAGIVSSAYSGKVLGERYHQIWAPLRVVIGFGLLIPIAGGFSSVHYILKDVVGRAAVNMGNAPILTYINHLGQNGGDIRVASMTGGDLLQDVLEREVCVAVKNGLLRARLFSLSGPIVPPDPTQEPKMVAGAFATTWNYGSCGSVGFSTAAQDTGTVITLKVEQIEEFHRARDAATADMINELRATFNDDVATNLGDYFATKSYKNKSGSEISKALEDGEILPHNIGPLMTKLSEDWNRKVAAEVRKLFTDQAQKENRTKELAKRIEKYGFMVAGSYERELSKIAGASASLANAQPYKTVPTPGWGYEDAFEAAMGAVYASRINSGVQMAEEGTQIATDGGNIFGTLIGSVFKFQSDPGLEQNSVDPIGKMISRGHTFLTMGVALLAAATAFSAGVEGSAAGTQSGWGAFLLPGGSVVSGAVKGTWMYISQWISWVVMILIALGILHSYVLPMIPMIMVFIMGMSWLIMFLEAAIAAVLWAFAFIRMDGQEFFDKNQSPGVALLFNLFLRPAIGMLAFIGGLLLLPTLLGSLETIWDDAFYSQTSQRWDYINVIKMLISWVMFCWMQWHLTIRLFGLIPTIADRVAQWMGLGGAGGYQDGQESGAATAAMVTAGMHMSKAPIAPQRSTGKSGGKGDESGGNSNAAGGGGATTGRPPLPQTK